MNGGRFRPHSQPVHETGSSPRFVFYPFADTYANNVVVFADLARELDHDGGRAAMLHELMSRPVDWDQLRLAPETEPKQVAKRESWTPPQWFVYRMMREVGEEAWITATDKDGNDLRRLKKSEVVNEYQLYLVETKSRREVQDARTELHNALKKLVAPDWDFNRAVSEKGVLVRDYWTLPPWSEFVASFAKAVGCSEADLLAGELREPEQDGDQRF